MVISTRAQFVVRVVRDHGHDAAAVQAVRRTVGWTTATVKEQFRQAARGRRVIFLAEQHGLPVGTITLEWRGTDPEVADGRTVAHISNLVVRPSHQRRGIGRALIEAAEAAAAARGYSAITIGVDEPNTYARQLYERWGYTWLKDTHQPWGKVHILARRLAMPGGTRGTPGHMVEAARR